MNEKKIIVVEPTESQRINLIPTHGKTLMTWVYSSENVIDKTHMQQKKEILIVLCLQKDKEFVIKKL